MAATHICAINSCSKLLGTKGTIITMCGHLFCIPCFMIHMMEQRECPCCLKLVDKHNEYMKPNEMDLFMEGEKIICETKTYETLLNVFRHTEGVRDFGEVSIQVKVNIIHGFHDLIRYLSIRYLSITFLNGLEYEVTKVDTESIDMCGICLGPIGIDNIMTTECGHTFCLDCLLMSLHHKNHCPMCRTNIIDIPLSAKPQRLPCEVIDQFVLDMFENQVDIWKCIADLFQEKTALSGETCERIVKQELSVLAYQFFIRINTRPIQNNLFTNDELIHIINDIIIDIPTPT